MLRRYQLDMKVAGSCNNAGRKSCAITTAQRLAQFLGDARIKDAGLNCNYVIASRPEGAATSERAVPVAIFSTEPAVARSFLRRWVGQLPGGALVTSMQYYSAYFRTSNPLGACSTE
jgi:DNA polymerase epsilon subunit 1